MAVRYEIEHTTTYRYANPVTLGDHKVMFLPRTGYAGRIHSFGVATNVPSTIRWMSDSLSNNVTVITFSEPTTELVITCRFSGTHFGVAGSRNFDLDARARTFPVQYSPDEWTDLVTFMRPHFEDLNGEVAAWARSFVSGSALLTTEVLASIMETIGATFTYQAREAEGTQSPEKTLREKSGTCRDYAWLMVETLRRLGLACRFVSGYLYDTAVDGGDVGAVGSGATHAWLAVFLPGAGWLNYDPTNRISQGFDLIPVAVARHPAQAAPLAGTWFGSASDYLGMQVHVKVHKVADLPIDIPEKGAHGVTMV